MLGKIHSYQTLGAVDGPGIRFVLFMQGCPLRCGYCHNPDTWDSNQPNLKQTPEQVLDKVMRYRSYFGEQGGITVSGGEPLLQAKFVKELFTLCKEQKIHSCLDTSGYQLDQNGKELLAVTNLVLLDVKMTSEEDYVKYTKASLRQVLHFLDYLEEQHISTWIRHVVVPGINDTQEDREKFEQLLEPYTVIEKVEYLPFHKMCVQKYEKLGIPFPFEKYQEMKEQWIYPMNKIK